MAKRTIPHIKLGIFVLAGIAFLILLLYIIGKNQNLFGKTFMLKARFEKTNGLMRGNNIRFAGIDAGTVKSVNIIN
ncbi:MAG TPA: MCE family protein, partial [Chitinophagaceae bacterium]